MDFIKYHIAGKDYIYCPDKNCFDKLTKKDISSVCKRHTGIGADGIFTFYQNSLKTGIIKGFLENGENMHDLSSVSICASFELFLTAGITDLTFICENHTNFTTKTDFAAGTNEFFCTLKAHPSEGIFSQINRKTEIGTRILTITPVSLHGIYTVHFTDCKEKLNIRYLGEHISGNSLFSKKASLILSEKIRTNAFDISFYENKTGCPRPTLSAFGATALAACRSGICNYGETISVSADGNTVYVTCNSPEAVTIKCTCEKVFKGKYDLL